MSCVHQQSPESYSQSRCIQEWASLRKIERTSSIRRRWKLCRMAQTVLVRKLNENTSSKKWYSHVMTYNTKTNNTRIDSILPLARRVRSPKAVTSYSSVNTCVGMRHWSGHDQKQLSSLFGWASLTWKCSVCCVCFWINFCRNCWYLLFIYTAQELQA